MTNGSIGRAARKNDMDEVLGKTLVKVADAMDATESGRDISALAIKIADLVERIEARGGTPSADAQPEKAVTTFEAISTQRSNRRKAAAG